MYKDGGGRGSTVIQQEATGGNEVRRNPDGTWPKGQRGGPGRPKAVDNRAYVQALAEGMPPERVMELINDAIAIAKETNSWRGVVAALEFSTNYTLGKPKQRIESTGAVSIGEMLAGLDIEKPLLPSEDADSSAI